MTVTQRLLYKGTLIYIENIKHSLIDCHSLHHPAAGQTDEIIAV